MCIPARGWQYCSTRKAMRGPPWLSLYVTPLICWKNFSERMFPKRLRARQPLLDMKLAPREPRREQSLNLQPNAPFMLAGNPRTGSKETKPSGLAASTITASGTIGQTLASVSQRSQGGIYLCRSETSRKRRAKLCNLAVPTYPERHAHKQRCKPPARQAFCLPLSKNRPRSCFCVEILSHSGYLASLLRLRREHR